jgi:5,10-methylenetetrahydrofolate reductase
MLLTDIFKQKKFVVTVELTTPRGTEAGPFLQHAERLRYIADAYNVTDNPRARLRISPLAAARLLVERKLNPVLQYTCRDRNRLALQADMLAAAVFGIDNLLLVTGDDIKAGTSGGKPVFDMDSVQLLKMAGILAAGLDLEGNRLQGKAEFCLGGVVNPGISPKWPQLWKMRKKKEAGASFFQTQAIFAEASFTSFMSCFREEPPPVLAGILLIKSGNQLRFLRDKVPGITIAPSLIEHIERYNDQVGAGREYLIKLILKIKSFCRGVHIMAPGMEEMLPGFIEDITNNI